MQHTKIGWCHHTHNHWQGCSHRSPGCKFCYAETLMDKRYKRVEWGAGKPRLRSKKATRQRPYTWNRNAQKLGIRQRVFAASLSDVFDEEVDQSWRAELFEMVRETTCLDWLMLTKRPENIVDMLPPDWDDGWDNVWLGTSCENQEMTDLRVPILSAIPAKIRFVSAEPLIGPVQLPEKHNIDWVIAGGESESLANARPMNIDWARSLRDQCEAQELSFFFKQTGTQLAKELGLKHKKGEDSNEWPRDLQIQDFPVSDQSQIAV